MRSSQWSAHLAVLLCAAGCVSSLAAQRAPRAGPPVVSLEVVSHSDLTFGTVLPGIVSTVPVIDFQRTALFEVRGAANIMVRLELAMPDALLGDGGARLPVLFGPGDGFADFSRGRPPRGLLFDPGTAVVASLGPNGRLWVRLGGRAVPARPQPGGTYRAIILLTVFDVTI